MPQQPAELEITHSILSAVEVARLVERHYAVGQVAGCQLLRRAFNEVYEITLAGCGRYAARLSALRRRGPANVEYEVSMLQHVRERGGPAAAPVMTRAGSPCVWLPLPEGERALVLFEFVEGVLPESAQEMEITGAGLARLHTAAEGYAGPESRYRLGIEHLLRMPLGWLLAAPTAGNALRAQFSALAQALEERLADAPALSTVACHGDCHGGNNFIQRPADGAATTSFFDFDDAGPGFLAYDLAVLPWSLLMRKSLAAPDADALEKWQRFLLGYRSQRAIPEADAAAIPVFVAVRHFWLMGEYASRAHHWGSQMIPASWLRKQVDLLRSWQELQTPPA